jgi:uncharacterized membrane protein
MNRWKMIGIIVVVGLGTIVLYRLAEGPKILLKEVFALGWGGIALLTSLRTDASGWMDKERRVSLNLHPLVQVSLAVILLGLAALATDWEHAAPHDWIYWLVALFTLPTYRPGFRWLRLRLAGNQSDEKG